MGKKKHKKRRLGRLLLIVLLLALGVFLFHEFDLLEKLPFQDNSTKEEDLPVEDIDLNAEMIVF